MVGLFVTCFVCLVWFVYLLLAGWVCWDLFLLLFYGWVVDMVGRFVVCC